MWALFNNRNIQPVRTVSELHASINKERARTDRTGMSFSLILLKPDSSGRRTATKKIIRLVRKRVRAVDSVGWFDSKHLAVLLPSTDLEGGRGLANSLSDYLHANGIRVFAAFFSYPAQKLEMQIMCEQVSSIA